MNATKDLIAGLPEGRRVSDFEEFWNNFEKFVFSRHAWGYSTKDILEPAEVEMTYDIASWLEAGKPKDPSAFKFPHPVLVRFELNPESKRELSAALEVWTDRIRGLSKLVTRVRVECQVRKASLITSRSFAGAAAGR